MKLLHRIDILLRVVENLTHDIDTSLEAISRSEDCTSIKRLETELIGLKSEEIFTLTRCARNKIIEILEGTYEDTNSETE